MLTKLQKRAIGDEIKVVDSINCSTVNYNARYIGETRRATK